MVVQAQRPIWSIPAAIGGAVVGAIVVVAAHVRNDPLDNAFVALLPFVVAALTGVAKNTTA
jgi:hypothetical protein